MLLALSVILQLLSGTTQTTRTFTTTVVNVRSLRPNRPLRKVLTLSRPDEGEYGAVQRHFEKVPRKVGTFELLLRVLPGIVLPHQGEA
jgi:hypothetical protein